tara:strand:- start:489 stop:803 length:315 start_codon:yes stop_codon:yes gene_type:complete
MSLDYGMEKLDMSLHYLSGSESKMERLFNAVTYSLIDIKPQFELPESLHEDFETLMTELTAVKTIDDNERVLATINSFDEDELSKAIEKIIDLHTSASRHYKQN